MSTYVSGEATWQVRESDFPRAGASADRLEFLLQYAVLAPSSHNTQPWRFAIDRADEISVYVDKTRWLRVADADQRELHISIGCAIENLVVAAERFGYAVRVAYFPEPGNEFLAATVSLRSTTSLAPTGNAELFDAIVARHTNHNAFDGRPLPEDCLEAFEACCPDPDVALYLTGDERVRSAVDDLVVRADAVQFSDPAFREELARWIGEGVFGTPWLLARIARLAVAYVNVGPSVGRKDSEVLMSAPALGLLVSPRNDRTTQVRAGRAFERIYLRATALGVAVRPMSQVLQVPEIKRELADLLVPRGMFPQQPFLLGFAEPAEHHTPRRSVRETLL
jgi:nitroreductase